MMHSLPLTGILRRPPGRSLVCLILLLLCCAAAVAVPVGPNYFPRSWTTDDGLPDNAVTAVVQTRDGYLWLGTYDGLARFDGAHFTTFNSANEPNLQSDRITSLYEDAQGVLWIGHERGDLTSYHNGKFTALNVHAPGIRRKITGIGTDNVGDVWMLSEEGTLVRVRDGATFAVPNTDGVVAMARDGAGRLWVASGGRLTFLADGRLQPVSRIEDRLHLNGYIQGLCASRDGGLWVVSGGEVLKYQGDTVTEDRGPNPCKVTVAVMIETRSGALAMGTSIDGVYLLCTNRAVLHFDQASGFPGDWIRSLAEDREGTLWVGAGSAGLTALRAGPIRTLDAPDHWQGRAVLTTTTSRDGAVWAGTEGAGLYCLQNGEWKNYAESSGLPNLYVWSVSQDAQGRLWAATWGGGIYYLQDGRFVRPPGLEEMNLPMAATLQGTDGATWIGTASGLVRYENGRTTWFGEKEGLKLPDVRAIAEAGDGTIWFGMLGGGLGRLQHGELKQFQKSDGLASDYVQCLKLDSDGTLWIGTYGSGLNRLKNGQFQTITMAQGLPNNFICAIEADDQGNFWISSHRGIFSVARNALIDCADGKISQAAFSAYGKADGLASLECSSGLQPAACKFSDGRICFATSKGLVIVDPSETTRRNPLPPPVVIQSVVVHGQGQNLGPDAAAPLRIPAGLQGFEFHFTGLSFVAPEKMRFQYRLAGWDADWVDAANDKREADYSYLPPGRYSFRVRACNSDGVWNNAGAAIALVVLPQIWQTWWFYTLATLAAVALVTRVAWIVSRRRMRRKLDDIRRQQAVERERTRIAKDIHDHLGANLTRISLLSQSAHGELENTAQAAMQLERIYETSRELTRSMDEIVWAVNPQHDTLDSLASYLGNFAQEYLVSLHLRCRLEVPLQLPHWPITAETRHNIFLAFKEVLHNVIKHSGATEVSVFLTTGPDHFTIVIRDNGRGFDPLAVQPRPGRGNGLKNLAQRLEKIGGRCEIQSWPGGGAEVSFRVNVALVAQTSPGPTDMSSINVTRLKNGRG